MVMDNKHRHETWNLMRLYNISLSENVWASRAIRRLKKKFFKNTDFIIYYTVFYNMNNVVINSLRDQKLAR